MSRTPVLGKYITYHKCGTVSMRIGEFLRSALGRKQLSEAKEARPQNSPPNERGSMSEIDKLGDMELEKKTCSCPSDWCRLEPDNGAEHCPDLRPDEACGYASARLK